MVAAVETMAYVKADGVPWHGLGVALESAPDSLTAIKAAGLDWEVAQAPLYALIDGVHVQVDGKMANFRTSDNAVLGITSDDYRTLNNRDAMAMSDEVIRDLGLEPRYTTAGALWGGKQIFAAAYLPDDIMVGAGTKREKLDRYLMLRTGHDGGTSLDLFPTAVRPVCWNTVNLALSSRGDVGVTTYHFGNWDDKRAQIRRYFQEQLGRFGEFEVLANQLAEIGSTPEHEARMENAIFPRVEKAPFGSARILSAPKVDELIQLVPADELQRWQDKRIKRLEIFRDVRKQEDGSLWGLFNTATGYADQARPHMWTRNPEIRFRQVMFRNGATLKTRALTLSKEFVGTGL